MHTDWVSTSKHRLNFSEFSAINLIQNMNLASINITLPKINGQFTEGISNSTIEALKASQKLAVIATESNSDQPTEKVKLTTENAIKYTLIYLNHRLNAQNKTQAEKRLLIAGAAVALRTGNIAFRNESDDGSSEAECPDGDWFQEDASIIKYEMTTQDAITFIQECIEQSELRRAANVIIGTKTNWFEENHHTGRYAEHGQFARQAIAAMYGNASVGALILAVNQLGRWVSTRSVLSQLKLSGCLPTRSIVKADSAFQPTDDITRQLTSTPAGTERLAFAYSLASKMLKHAVAILCPDIGDFARLSQAYGNVLRRPAAYHLEAKYLTGHRELYDDIEFDGFLGRVGAWANVFYPLYVERMLTKIPHIISYKDSLDYDADFEINCCTFRNGCSNPQFFAQRKEKLTQAFANVNRAVTATYVSVCEAFGVQPNTQGHALFEKNCKINDRN